MDNKSAFKVKVKLSKTYEYPISVIDTSYLESDATSKSISDFITDLESISNTGLTPEFFEVNVVKEPIFKFRKKAEKEEEKEVNTYQLIKTLTYDALEAEFGVMDPIKNPDIFEKSNAESGDNTPVNILTNDSGVKVESTFYLKPKIEDRYYQLLAKFERMVEEIL